MGTFPRNVVVVEDDLSMRTSVQRLLSAHGFATEVYPSAESFLGRRRADKIDCLVVDINLGGMSGIDLWKRLNDPARAPPIIFMTAVDDEDLEYAATRLGCVAYLHKPFSAASLMKAVHQALTDPWADPV